MYSDVGGASVEASGLASLERPVPAGSAGLCSMTLDAATMSERCRGYGAAHPIEKPEITTGRSAGRWARSHRTSASVTIVDQAPLASATLPRAPAAEVAQSAVPLNSGTHLAAAERGFG